MSREPTGIEYVQGYGRLREKCGLGQVIDGEVVQPRPALTTAGSAHAKEA